MKFTRECEIGKTTKLILKIFLQKFDNTVILLQILTAYSAKN